MVEFIFLMGVNVYGWRSSGVNHVLIFELDPRHHLTEQHLMEMAAVLGVVGALSVLSFIYAPALSVPPYVNPLALVLIMLAFAFNPFRTFRHEARFWFLRVFVSILSRDRGQSRTVAHKSHSPCLACFHVFLIEAGVMTFVAHCTHGGVK